MESSVNYKTGILALIILVMHNPRVCGSWSTSTIIEIAADLLNPSDDQGLQSADPLLNSNQQYSVSQRTKGPLLEGRDDGVEQFIVPMLSNSVGDNNQLIEYMATAVVGRATYRTLCLTPFFNGPIKHTRHFARGDLTMEERYDINALSKFVKVASFQKCLQECNKQIDGFWWLRHSSASTLARDWSWDHKKVRTHELGRSYATWTSTGDIKSTAQEFSEEKCVAIGGLFPGLRWRGAYLAASLYMRASQSIVEAATHLQDLAIGRNRSFLAVHWRFEESLCKGEQLGLCFLRCGDGAVIDSGLRAVARSLPEASMEPSSGIGTNTRCKHISGSKAVMVSQQDLVTAIRNKASKENVSSVYLATDGWLRGSQAQALLKKVVEDLRRRGLAVTGLWKVKGLPNLITTSGERMYGDEMLKRTLMKSKVSGHAISEVEQEICLRASSFLGSGESTWSLAVFRARLATRKWQQATLPSGASPITRVDNRTQDDAVIIEELLRDMHAAGMQCRYRSLYSRAKVKGIVPEESYQDEAPDSWLDMEACEAQLSVGGSCKLIDCFP